MVGALFTSNDNTLTDLESRDAPTSIFIVTFLVHIVSRQILCDVTVMLTVYINTIGVLFVLFTNLFR